MNLVRVKKHASSFGGKTLPVVKIRPRASGGRSDYLLICPDGTERWFWDSEIETATSTRATLERS